MPEIDGLEVARRLRGRTDSARMLLVAMTGFGQPEDRRQTAAAGFDHHLTKPLDPMVIQALLAMRRRSHHLLSPDAESACVNAPLARQQHDG
jgi:CheY-like chemotaxis protein